MTYAFISQYFYNLAASHSGIADVQAGDADIIAERQARLVSYPTSWIETPMPFISGDADAPMEGWSVAVSIFGKAKPLHFDQIEHIKDKTYSILVQLIQRLLSDQSAGVFMGIVDIGRLSIDPIRTDADNLVGWRVDIRASTPLCPPEGVTGDSPYAQDTTLSLLPSFSYQTGASDLTLSVIPTDVNVDPSAPTYQWKIYESSSHDPIIVSAPSPTLTIDSHISPTWTEVYVELQFMRGKEIAYSHAYIKKGEAAQSIIGRNNPY